MESLTLMAAVIWKACHSNSGFEQGKCQWKYWRKSAGFSESHSRKVKCSLSNVNEIIAGLGYSRHHTKEQWIWSCPTPSLQPRFGSMWLVVVCNSNKMFQRNSFDVIMKFKLLWEMVLRTCWKFLQRVWKTCLVLVAVNTSTNMEALLSEHPSYCV